MSTNKNRLYYQKKRFKLFEKYRDGKSNPTEQEFVNAYDEWFDNKTGYYENLPVEEQNALVERMLEDAHARMKDKPEVPLYRRIVSKLTAAAAILLLIDQ